MWINEKYLVYFNLMEKERKERSIKSLLADRLKVNPKDTVATSQKDQQYSLEKKYKTRTQNGEPASNQNPMLLLTLLSNSFDLLEKMDPSTSYVTTGSLLVTISSH
jgi:hypothetical protein